MGTTATGGVGFVAGDGGTTGAGWGAIIGIAGCDFVSEFNSAGRGFGKGAITCGATAGFNGIMGNTLFGAKAGFNGVTGNTFDRAAAGAPSLAFGLRTSNDLVLDILHLAECTFE